MELNDTLLKSAGNKKILIDKNARLIQQTQTGTRDEYLAAQDGGLNLKNLGVENTIQVGNDIFIDGMSVKSSVYKGFTFGGVLTPLQNQIPLDDHLFYYKKVQAGTYSITIQPISEQRTPLGMNQVIVGFIKFANGYLNFADNIHWVNASTRAVSTTAPEFTNNKMTFVKFTWHYSNYWLAQVMFIADSAPTI